jgi:predicted dienelactone hydrolase
MQKYNSIFLPKNYFLLHIFPRIFPEISGQYHPYREMTDADAATFKTVTKKWMTPAQDEEKNLKEFQSFYDKKKKLMEFVTLEQRQRLKDDYEKNIKVTFWKKFLLRIWGDENIEKI